MTGRPGRTRLPSPFFVRVEQASVRVVPARSKGTPSSELYCGKPGPGRVYEIVGLLLAWLPSCQSNIDISVQVGRASACYQALKGVLQWQQSVRVNS